MPAKKDETPEVETVVEAPVHQEVDEEVEDVAVVTDEDPLVPARLASALKSPSYAELNPGFAL